MEPVDCPVLSSSSFGVDAQQPMLLILIRECVEDSRELLKAIQKSLKSVRGSPMAMRMRNRILRLRQESSPRKRKHKVLVGTSVIPQASSRSVVVTGYDVLLPRR